MSKTQNIETVTEETVKQMEEPTPPVSEMEESVDMSMTQPEEEDPIVGYDISDSALVPLSGQQYKILNEGIMQMDRLLYEFANQFFLIHNKMTREFDIVTKNLVKTGKTTPVRKSETEARLKKQQEEKEQAQ